MFTVHGTTSLALDFATFLMWLLPNVKTKLYESRLDRAECDITIEYITQMKHLDMVLNFMRL